MGAGLSVPAVLQQGNLFLHVFPGLMLVAISKKLCRVYAGSVQEAFQESAIFFRECAVRQTGKLVPDVQAVPGEFMPRKSEPGQVDIDHVLLVHGLGRFVVDGADYQSIDLLDEVRVHLSRGGTFEALGASQFVVRCAWIVLYIVKPQRQFDGICIPIHFIPAKIELAKTELDMSPRVIATVWLGVTGIYSLEQDLRGRTGRAATRPQIFESGLVQIKSRLNRSPGLVATLIAGPLPAGSGPASFQ